MHFADRLFEAVRRKQTPLCVGLDPRWDLLPLAIRHRHGETQHGRARAYEEFCSRVIDVVAPLVGVIKPQSAFFEACGPAGMTALFQLIQRAHRRDLVVILDAKRNDIASTAEAYAEAAFHAYQADALTINPYLGSDSIESFVKMARPLDRGIFVLTRTSNPGCSQFQSLASAGKAMYAHVAEAIGRWSRENLGGTGYGDIGAVIGATSPAELKELRALAPHVPFLVPGFGAQGGTAADAAAAFRSDGLGAVVNSARAILFSFEPSQTNWEAAVESATRGAIQQLALHSAAGRLSRALPS
jgi:orotidine-5'-phosphate decarboxylase